MGIVWVVLLILLVVAGAAVLALDRLRSADVAASEALADVDVQLTRRADLVPDLVRAVQSSAPHEHAVFTAAAKARADVAEATRKGGVGEKAAAQRRLDHAIAEVLAAAEAYPDLRASDTFLSLQTRLAETEGALAFARRYYDDASGDLDRLVSTFPWMFLAGLAGFRRRELFGAPRRVGTPPRGDL